jgi:hypothetical protein
VFFKNSVVIELVMSYEMILDTGYLMLDENVGGRVQEEKIVSSGSLRARREWKSRF